MIQVTYACVMILHRFCVVLRYDDMSSNHYSHLVHLITTPGFQFGHGPNSNCVNWEWVDISRELTIFGVIELSTETDLFSRTTYLLICTILLYYKPINLVL